jgi:hypothetical protein
VDSGAHLPPAHVASESLGSQRGKDEDDNAYELGYLHPVLDFEHSGFIVRIKLRFNVDTVLNEGVNDDVIDKLSQDVDHELGLHRCDVILLGVRPREIFELVREDLFLAVSNQDEDDI